MIDVRQKNERVVSVVQFDEIRIGDCFYDETTDMLWLKTDIGTAICLENGAMDAFHNQDRVTEVNVEVRWEFKTV